MNPQAFTPNRIMVLSALVFGAMGYLAYYWLTQPLLTAADVTQFSGPVKEARAFSGKNGYLEITLENQPHPFRSFATPYPGEFKIDLRQRLAIGSPVTLGVATSEVGSPRKNWAQNQLFFEFITMTVGNDEALPLDAHNKSVASNKKIGPWFCLVMALLCAWLFWVGFRHRGAPQSLIEIMKAKQQEKKKMKAMS